MNLMPWFVRFYRTDLKKIKAQFPPLGVAQGQHLFYKNHIPLGLYVIHEGLIGVGLHETLRTRWVLEPGTCLGFHQVMHQTPSPYHAFVLKKALISFIPKRTFFELPKKHVLFLSKNIFETHGSFDSPFFQPKP